jgi:formamidopyrimidine-DNA glycosylase
MPELPDLEHIIAILKPEIEKQTIRDFTVSNPIAFTHLLPVAAEKNHPNNPSQQIHRHGPFVVLAFSGDLLMVVHPMLAGRFFLTKAKAAQSATNCFSIEFFNGSFLTYQDQKQMGKVYVLASKDSDKIPRFATQGPDVLSPEFSRDYFLEKISRDRKQVRVFLMSQETISAIGNAYADEILFHAGIHPKTFCYQLPDADKNRLYDSILEVITWGIKEVESANRPVQEKVRAHVRVRNRQGRPCPKCGAKIRRAGVRGYDAFFCPQCQPAVREQFISWR